MVKERVYTSTLPYAVRRRDPELIGPAAQTPRETKRLSDLDDTDALRGHVSLAFFYRGASAGAGAGEDPAVVIRRALGEALVHYYPLAGRLREIEGRKLVVDCTGEGVLFVEADAEVHLADLEAAGLTPPFPCWDQLLFDVEGSSGMLNCPLLLIQVTRLLCGGFVFALRFNHTMCDGLGIVQFLKAVGELARGLPIVTVTPVWSRELIEAPSPATATATATAHMTDYRLLPPSPDMVTRSFIFGGSDIAAMKKSLPVPLGDTATTFDVLAAFLWRARTAALELPPGQDAPVGIVASFKGDTKMNLPAGYYGNTCVSSTALVDAVALRGGSLADAVALVRLAKDAVTTEYVRSVVGFLVMHGRRFPARTNMFILSDCRRLGYEGVDFGWGRPVFGGPAVTFSTTIYFIAVKDHDGVEDAVAMLVALPRLAMDRFAAEVERSLLHG